MKPSAVYWASSGCSTRMTLPGAWAAISAASGFSLCAEDGRGDGGWRAEALRGSEGFPVDAGDLASALFHDYKDAAHRTCASVRELFNQRSRGFFGCAGEHLRGFLFLGQGDLFEHDDGAGDRRRGRRRRAACTSLVLARLMPMSVA